MSLGVNVCVCVCVCCTATDWRPVTCLHLTVAGRGSRNPVTSIEVERVWKKDLWRVNHATLVFFLKMKPLGMKRSHPSSYCYTFDGTCEERFTTIQHDFCLGNKKTGSKRIPYSRTKKTYSCLQCSDLCPSGLAEENQSQPADNAQRSSLHCSFIAWSVKENPKCSKGSRPQSTDGQSVFFLSLPLRTNSKTSRKEQLISTTSTTTTTSFIFESTMQKGEIR